MALMDRIRELEQRVKSLEEALGDTSGQHGAGDADSTSGAQDGSGDTQEGLVERVANAIEVLVDGPDGINCASRAAIREVADAVDEAYHVGYFCNVSSWLRAQLEDSDA